MSVPSDEIHSKDLLQQSVGIVTNSVEHTHMHAVDVVVSMFVKCTHDIGS